MANGVFQLTAPTLACPVKRLTPHFHTFPVAGQSHVCFRLNLQFSFQLKPTTLSRVSGLFFHRSLATSPPEPRADALMIFDGSQSGRFDQTKPQSHHDGDLWMKPHDWDQQKRWVFDMNAGCDKMGYSRW